jgi:hypothetical protein
MFCKLWSLQSVESGSLWVWKQRSKKRKKNERMAEGTEKIKFGNMFFVSCFAKSNGLSISIVNGLWSVFRSLKITLEYQF